jgi:hypothetical protein
MRFTTLAAIVVCAVNTALLTAGAEKARIRASFASALGVAPSAAPSSSVTASAPASSSARRAVTITGCLKRDDGQFRLVDTAGAQAPQSRSWKSGFLRKRPSKLDVVDPSNRIRLQDHVSHRVALTGIVNDGEMRVQAIRHLAPSCGN